MTLKRLRRPDDPHDFLADGPHVVTGPIAVEGAEPGDVLKVEVLDLAPRVPYGVITNRHFKGALPDEFPEKKDLKQQALKIPKHTVMYRYSALFIRRTAYGTAQ